MNQLPHPVYYVRYMGWFRMSVMHTKLIRMKWGMFWNILQVTGVHQGQVRRLHRVLVVVQSAPESRVWLPRKFLTLNGMLIAIPFDIYTS
jgi:hypothetical protein